MNSWCYPHRSCCARGSLPCFRKFQCWAIKLPSSKYTGWMCYIWGLLKYKDVRVIGNKGKLETQLKNTFLTGVVYLNKTKTLQYLMPQLWQKMYIHLQWNVNRREDNMKSKLVVLGWDWDTHTICKWRRYGINWSICCSRQSLGLMIRVNRKETLITQGLN